MPEYTTIKVPHFAAVVPFNMSDPTGRPLYTVEHLVNGEGEIFAMICEGARQTPRCASCGDSVDDPTIRGTFSGYKFKTPWDKTGNPHNAPEFELIASIEGDKARDRVLDQLIQGDANGGNTDQLEEDRPTNDSRSDDSA